MRIPVIAALICFYPAFAQTAATVKIRVVNSLTKFPISGANVTVDGARGAQTDQLAGRTDTNGVFAGSVEFAGGHLLTVRHKGYRMTGAGIMGKMIEIQPGPATEITLEMRPLAVLAGRVLDQYGDPVRHAIVSTQAKSRVPMPGEYYESLFAATTDDRGEYRIADVEPGKYYLVFEYLASDERNYRPQSRYQWPEFGGLTLFPDATDIEHAQQVEVGAGETNRIPDAHLKLERAVTVSGRVSGQASDRGMVNLQRAGPRLNRHQPGVGRQIEADGTFHAEVLPGTYEVKGTDRSGKASPVVRVEARANVQGVELTLGRGYEITGRIAVDGGEHLDFSKLILHFFGEPAKIDSAGAFHAIAPGHDAGYMIQGLPEDWYVKEFKVAGRSVVGKQFQLEPGLTDVILTLSPKGASVEIAAEGGSGGLDDVMHAAAFALLPESGIVDVNSMFASDRGDPSGKFILHGVPPGDYRVFALDISNWPLLFDPGALLEKYRKLAPLVTVTEGEHKKIVVPPTKIPVE